jgi:hypothetical protein
MEDPRRWAIRNLWEPQKPGDILALWIETFPLVEPTESGVDTSIPGPHPPVFSFTTYGISTRVRTLYCINQCICVISRYQIELECTS